MAVHAKKYGEGTATYEAVGGHKLVSDFYQIMDKSEDYRSIRDMHPKNLEVSIDKLVSFLSGWMGGEPLYLKKYGGGGMPQVHKHLTINEAERDMWLACMNEALLKQDYPESLVEYLNTQLAFPAHRIEQVNKAHRGSE